MKASNFLTLLYIAILFCAMSVFNLAHGQSVGISNDASIPDSSAILDIKSNSKGLLIPRMSSAERSAISNPQKGLLVFDNDQSSFWYYDDSQWSEIKNTDSQMLSVSGNVLTISNGNSTDLSFLLDNTDAQTLTTSGNMLTISNGNSVIIPLANRIADADNDTRVETERTTDDDLIRFYIQNAQEMSLSTNASGVPTLEITGDNTNIGYNAGDNSQPSGIEGKKNTFIGYQSGTDNLSGYNNVGLGYQSLYKNSSGDLNIAIGNETLEDNTTGNSNIAIGNRALANSTTSHQNIGIGQGALAATGVGSGNVGLGYLAGANTTGANNVFLGNLAGNLNTGSGNVFIGYAAGQTNTDDNRLIIDNSNTLSPLIYGEFDNDLIKINGTLQIDEYSFPTSAGSQGQILLAQGQNPLIYSPYSLPNTSGAVDQILQLDGSGQLLWKDIPAAVIPRFERSGTIIQQVGDFDTDDLLFGSDHMPTNGEEITDTLFFFDKSKAAFRLGYTDGSKNWSPDSIGLGSFSFGWGNKAKGENSAAWGASTMATGQYSTAWGFLTKSTAYNSTAWGGGSQAHGTHSTAWGSYSKSEGKYATAWGGNTVASSGYETALGRYNTPYSPIEPEGWNPLDRLFVIGNGTGISQTSDALVILKNGHSTFDGVVSHMNDLIVGTSDAPVNGTSITDTILLVEDEKMAMRFGYYLSSTNASPDSLGFCSFGYGYNPKVKGRYAMAGGNLCSANFDNSIALGSAVNTYSEYEVVLGRHNTEYVASLPNGWSGSDRIFTVGNGTSTGLRSNALTIYKNGDIEIGNISTNGYRLAIDGKAICEELRVQDSGSWPDYVFTNSYDLMPLNEVANHITEYGHLPGVPSASEIETNGQHVGEVQRILLEKIEELTLHVIQLQNEINTLKTQTK